MFRTVVVPLDGSPAAESAVPFAAAEARGHGASLVLVRVVPRPEVIVQHGRGGGPLPMTRHWEDRDLGAAQSEAEQYLEAIVRQHGLAPETRIVVAVGDPYTRLAAELERRPGCLVVIATEGAADTGSTMGDLARRLMRHGAAAILGVGRTPAPGASPLPAFPPSFTYDDHVVG